VFVVSVALSKVHALLSTKVHNVPFFFSFDPVNDVHMCVFYTQTYVHPLSVHDLDTPGRTPDSSPLLTNVGKSRSSPSDP
jgi:hypothetical protein